MSNLTIFEVNGNEIRVLGTPERPQFVAADVCLRSYQLGNGSPDLAKEVADHAVVVLAEASA